MSPKALPAWSWCLAALTLVAASSTALNAQPEKAATSDKKPFSIEQGYYVEACSCRAPCPCELTGAMKGCEGVGAYSFDKAMYDGQDLSGTKIAYALFLGETVIVYIDAPDAKKHAAVEKFARAALAGFGPIKQVKDAKVEISGKDGAYTAKVDGGKVMSCTTEPVMGGDGKTPLVHTNTQDALNPTMYQGRCTSCTYTDGDNKIELEKGRNSYFNQHMKSSGKL